MDLESLLKAMNAAKKALAADPQNKELQTASANAEKAYNDAKAAAETDDPPGEGGGGEDDPPAEKDELEKLDEKAKADLIRKLRKENAGHRTKAKDLASKLKEDAELVQNVKKALGLTEEEKPEEKIRALDQDKNQLAFSNAILASAIEHGIPKDQVDFFEFLVTKATRNLEEGEELSDETMGEIVKQCTNKQTGKKGGANSTVTDGKGSGNPPPPDNGGDADKITVEKFCSMGVIEQSKLFLRNPDLYNRLHAEAKAKKKSIIG